MDVVAAIVAVQASRIASKETLGTELAAGATIGEEPTTLVETICLTSALRSTLTEVPIPAYQVKLTLGSIDATPGRKIYVILPVLGKHLLLNLFIKVDFIRGGSVPHR